MNAAPAPIPCVLLAGGRASRLGGGDKPLRMIGGVSILARIVAQLRPQCSELVISANGDPARFAEFGIPVLADALDGFKGPLAGILAGLDWTAAHHPGTKWMASVTADTPVLPDDLIARLYAARAADNADLAVASSGGRRHHAVALWSIALRDDMRRALCVEDNRGVGQFAARHRVAVAEWPAEPRDPFFNINTADDLAHAERLASFDHG